MLPGLALQRDAYPHIHVMRLQNPVVSRGLVLITRKTAELSPAAQALYEMVKAYPAQDS